MRARRSNGSPMSKRRSDAWRRSSQGRLLKERSSARSPKRSGAWSVRRRSGCCATSAKAPRSSWRAGAWTATSSLRWGSARSSEATMRRRGVPHGARGPDRQLRGSLGADRRGGEGGQSASLLRRDADPRRGTNLGCRDCGNVKLGADAARHRVAPHAVQRPDGNGDRQRRIARGPREARRGAGCPAAGRDAGGARRRVERDLLGRRRGGRGPLSDDGVGPQVRGGRPSRRHRRHREGRHAAGPSLGV